MQNTFEILVLETACKDLFFSSYKLVIYLVFAFVSVRGALLLTTQSFTYYIQNSFQKATNGSRYLHIVKKTLKDFPACFVKARQ